jgi:hypothetical protein
LNSKRHIFRSSGERIAIRLVPLAGNIFYDVNVIGMDLVKSGEMRLLKIQCRQKALPVFMNSLGRIPGGVAKVE